MLLCGATPYQQAGEWEVQQIPRNRENMPLRDESVCSGSTPVLWINTWWGSKEDKARLFSVTMDRSRGNRHNLTDIKIFLLWRLEHVAWRDCGVSILDDTYSQLEKGLSNLLQAVNSALNSGVGLEHLQGPLLTSIILWPKSEHKMHYFIEKRVTAFAFIIPARLGKNLDVSFKKMHMWTPWYLLSLSLQYLLVTRYLSNKGLTHVCKN